MLSLHGKVKFGGFSANSGDLNPSNFSDSLPSVSELFGGWPSKHHNHLEVILAHSYFKKCRYKLFIPFKNIPL